MLPSNIPMLTDTHFIIGGQHLKRSLWGRLSELFNKAVGIPIVHRGITDTIYVDKKELQRFLSRQNPLDTESAEKLRHDFLHTIHHLPELATPLDPTYTGKACTVQRMDASGKKQRRWEDMLSRIFVQISPDDVHACLRESSRYILFPFMPSQDSVIARLAQRMGNKPVLPIPENLRRSEKNFLKAYNKWVEQRLSPENKFFFSLGLTAPSADLIASMNSLGYEDFVLLGEYARQNGFREVLVPKHATEELTAFLTHYNKYCQGLREMEALSSQRRKVR